MTDWKTLLQRYRKPLPAFLALTALLLAAGLWWWTGRGSGEPFYLTEPVRRGDISHTISATGEVKAAHLVTVGAQVSGQITRLHVNVGQQVLKGDLLAEINSTKQKNQLETDRARLQSYQAQLESKKISLRVAERQYKRGKNLHAGDAASREDLENAETALALAKAEVAALEAQVRETTLAVDTDAENLGYTRITAPLDGTVVSVPVDEGQTVNAAQTTPTIVQIADLNKMEIWLEISEGDIPSVSPGMEMSYTILGEPDTRRTAVIDSIDPGLTTLSDGSYETSSSGVSGSSGSSSSSSSDTAVYYYARAVVDNNDAHLHIGMTAQASITAATHKGVLLAPLLAVENAAGGRFVRVLDADGKVQTRPVTTGLTDGVRVEIRSGLENGAKVIVGELTQAQVEASEQRRGPGPGGPH